jgi:SAM-dependent methyltransferase
MTLNSSRWRLRQENAAFAAAIPEGSLVLDAGAGSAPYKDLFSHTRYESADFEKVEKKYAKSTYVCDLSNIPVEDCRFDFIVFNQVLEHLPEPKLVLAELHRILKPGGKMIATQPLFYEEHEQPYDFYRYTQFGLRHLFTATGFEVERLDWLEGYFGTVAYQLSGMARDLPWGFSTTPVKLWARAWAPVLHRLELRTKYVARGYPKNYVAIVSRH